MSRRPLAALAAGIAVLALALTGCSGGAASSGSATSGDLTIDWQPDYKPNMDWLIKRFEAKYPEAHVTVNYVDQSQYFSLIRTQLQAGTAPDVLWSTPGNGNPTAMEVLAGAGYLADLSKEHWVDSLRPSLAQYGRLKGRTYLLQTNVSAFGVLYNDGAVAKAGLTKPTDWNGVLRFCAAAERKGLQAYAMGAQDLFFTQQFIYSSIPTLVYKADPRTDAEMRSGSLTFPTSPGWRQTVQKYQQAKDAGCFGSKPAGTSFTTAVGNVATGKSLGVIGAYLFASPITAANPKVSLSFGAFPIASDPWLMVGAFGGTAVNAKAKHPALARTFVDFLAQPDVMAGYSAQGVGSLSTIRGGTASASQPAGLKTIEQYLDSGRSVTFVDQNWPNPDVQQAMYDSTQSMLVGRGRPADILTAMQAKW